MDVLLLKEGSEVAEIDKTVKNKWRWGWLCETGENGKAFSLFVVHVFAWYATRKVSMIVMAKKVLAHHQSEAGLKAGIHALQNVLLPWSDNHHTGGSRILSWLTMCAIRHFKAEHDLLLTTLQPLVNLIQSVAEDQRAFSRWSISNVQASYLGSPEL